MKIIGLTGGIATGKSLLAEKLKVKGYTVFDADIATKDFYKEEENLKQVKDIIGTSKIEEIREIVFKNKEALRKLENIIHPFIKKQIEKFILRERQAGEKMIFLEVPLLLEGDLWQLCDHLIYIYADENAREERFLQRNKGSIEIFNAIKNRQIKLEDAKKFKPFLIKNTGTKEHLYRKLDMVLETIENL